MVSQPARWFQVSSGRLWFSFARNKAQSVAVNSDPMVTTNYSATLALGDGFMQSEDAQTFEANMFIGFPDGLYQGNQSGTFNNILSDVGEYISSDNVRDVSVHDGALVVAEGAHVWSYKPAIGANSTLRQIWPNVDVRPVASRNAPANLAGMNFRGSVQALQGFGRWLYAGVFNGSQSMIFCGVDASAPLPYVWHPMQLLGPGDGTALVCKVSRIHVDSITTASDGTQIPRRIWVATDASFGAQAGCTAPIYFWQIPRGDEQPFADSSFSPNYAVQAWLEHPVTDWGAPGTWKVWRKVETWSETIGSSVLPGQESLVVDGTMNAGWVSGGDQVTTTPKFTGYLSNASQTAIGQSGQFQFLSTCFSGMATPVWRSHIIRGSERPRSNDTITAKLRVADNMHDRQGNEMRDSRTQLAELRSFALSSNPYALVDLTGATVPVVVLPPVEEQETYQQGSDNPELVVTLKMGVLDASWSPGSFTPVNPHGG